MTAEIIGVGKQSLSEELMEKVGQFFYRELVALGIEITYQSIAGEDRQKFSRLVAQAVKSSDIIFVLGGLGATESDFSKELIAKGLGIDMAVNEESLERIRNAFEKAGRQMPKEYTTKVAMLPKGCIPFPNDRGMSYGCAISSNGGKKCIVLLPLSEKEIYPMFTNYVSKYVAGFCGSGLANVTINVYGINEEQVCNELGDLLSSKNPTVVLKNVGGEITIDVSAKGATKQQANAICNPFVRDIVSRLGENVYGFGGGNLPAVTIAKLEQKGLTIATAEDVTEGQLYQLIRSANAKDTILTFAATVKSENSKIERLNIPKKTLHKYANEHEKLAILMAEGAMARGNSDIGIAICTDSPKQAYVAVCDKQNVWTEQVTVSNAEQSIEALKYTACMCAINLLRLYLFHLPNVLDGAVAITEALKGAAKKRSGKKKSSASPPEKEKHKAHTPLWQKLVLTCLILVFVGSIGYIGNHYLQSFLNKKLSNQLQDMLETPDADIPPEKLADYPAEYQSKFASLYAANADLRGWIELKNTPLAYPVVQGKDNLYYERLDFYRKSNQHGIPFLDYEASINPNSDNMIIYGHNMKDGQMFGELLNYKKVDYLVENPIISFNTLLSDAKYKVVSVFITNTHAEHGKEFKYYEYTNFSSPEQNNQFITEILERSIVDTGVDVKQGDKLLTLSTCTYEFLDARFVVVGRKLRAGEKETIDSKKVALNPDPFYPDAWYEVTKQPKPANRAASPSDIKPAMANNTKPQSSSEATTDSVPETVIPEVESSSTTTSQAQPNTVSPPATSSNAASSSQASSAASSSQSSAASSSQASSAASGSQAPPPVTSNSVTSSSSGQSSGIGIVGSPNREQAPNSSIQSGSGINIKDLFGDDITKPPTAKEEEQATLMGQSNNTIPNDNPLVVPPPVAGTTASLMVAGVAASENNAADIVAQIVMSEMGPTFTDEALKAQAIAIYSFILYENKQGRTPNMKLSPPTAKITNAVNAVLGQTVQYNGSLAFTPFHAMSAGATACSKDVWGGYYPYLTTVDSSVDKSYRTYQKSVEMNSSSVAQRVEQVLGIVLSGDPSTWFSIVSYAEGGYNGTMSVGGYTTSPKSGKTITGRVVRESVLNLRSARFDTAYNPATDRFTFTTYGYGHGVGMSQIGADEYAMQGWNYVQILTHYYPGTTVG